MKKSSNNELFEKELEGLPPKAQQAICWIAENFDAVLQLCKEPDMTEQEIKKQIVKAAEKDDYLAVALLSIAQMYKDKECEAQQDNPD